MEPAVTARAHILAERQQDAADERERYLAHLRARTPHGVSLFDLWTRLGQGCDIGHSRTVLRELADRGEAREREGVWFFRTRKPVAPAHTPTSVGRGVEDLQPAQTREQVATMARGGTRPTPSVPPSAGPLPDPEPGAERASSRRPGEKIGAWVRRRRTTLGMTQSDLARVLAREIGGRPNSLQVAISALERGRQDRLTQHEDVLRAILDAPGSPGKPSPVLPSAGEPSLGGGADSGPATISAGGAPGGLGLSSLSGGRGPSQRGGESGAPSGHPGVADEGGQLAGASAGREALVGASPSRPGLPGDRHLELGGDPPPPDTGTCPPPPGPIVEAHGDTPEPAPLLGEDLEGCGSGTATKAALQELEALRGRCRELREECEHLHGRLPAVRALEES